MSSILSPAECANTLTYAFNSSFRKEEIPATELQMMNILLCMATQGTTDRRHRDEMAVASVWLLCQLCRSYANTYVTHLAAYCYQ